MSINTSHQLQEQAQIDEESSSGCRQQRSLLHGGVGHRLQHVQVTRGDSGCRGGRHWREGRHQDDLLSVAQPSGTSHSGPWPYSSLPSHARHHTNWSSAPSSGQQLLSIQTLLSRQPHPLTLQYLSRTALSVRCPGSLRCLMLAPVRGRGPGHGSLGSRRHTAAGLCPAGASPGRLHSSVIAESTTGCWATAAT